MGSKVSIYSKMALSAKNAYAPLSFGSQLLPGKLEEQDFLIFQAAKVQPEEMRGLSVAYDTFPIMALNRKDEPSARLRCV